MLAGTDTGAVSAREGPMERTVTPGAGGDSPLVVLAGSANPRLAAAVASELGLKPAPSAVDTFPDGEVHVSLETDVRGSDVWIVQPTAPPAERHIAELLLLADACWRVGCARLSAAVPYFGYARQDRRCTASEALGGRVMADVLGVARLDRLVVVDPHSPALEAMLSMPADTVSAMPLLAAALHPWITDDAVVVAPDLGAAKLAERYAAVLGLPVAHVRKARVSGTVVLADEVVGPVQGRTPVIIDDMISTGGTLAAATNAVLGAGSGDEVLLAATHALLVGTATDTLSALPVRKLFVTDTVVPSGTLPGGTEVVSIAPLIAAAIAGTRNEPP
jgi:ribose-phosphate pyrophosphokinase